ncbi:MAG: cysteine desulfurase [Magnetococcales bacterium]|nr:cysteine desulfurase [Magnetococcales bacterium]
MIYLDHNATSPVHPHVLEGMLPFFTERAGNPSSVHGAGRAARQGLDEARRRVAVLLDVHESQIVFTSGGTEANNMALFGYAARCKFRGHLVTSAVEHPSLLQVCERLKRYGMAVTVVGVDGNGCVRPEEVFAALRADTILVSIMHANNETGVVQPVAEIGQGCRTRSPAVAFHVDAVQTVGKIPVRFAALAVDMLSLSAHKFGGPKGVGALVIDKSFVLDPLLVGGGQERGRRAGTENLPGIVGCGLAAERVQTAMAAEHHRLQQLQKHLEAGLQAAIPECLIFGQQAAVRLPNTTALGISGIHGETVVMNLDLAGFAVSSGSACGSGRSQPSHVPTAMGMTSDLASSMVRVSLGWNTAPEDVEQFVVCFAKVIKRLQPFSHAVPHGTTLALE